MGTTRALCLLPCLFLRQTQGLRAVHLYVVCKQAFYGKKVEERIKADYNREEEGRGRKCSRYSHFYPMLRVRLPALRKRQRYWLENCRIKLLTVATASFDPQLRMPC